MQPAQNLDLAATFEHVAHGLIAEPAFHDVEIVHTTATKRGATFELTLIVDRTGGVDMVTIETIAKRINAALEEFPTHYTLAVQSAGLDRPLFRAADYDRFKGANVKIVTTLTIEKAKTHRGVLLGMRGENIILEMPKIGELPIPLAAVKTANVEYDIRADLARDKQGRRQQS